MFLKIHLIQKCFFHKVAIRSINQVRNSTSGVCFAISLMSVATFFFTYSSGSLRQVRTAGKISASTTISARSTECLEIWLRAENTCLWKRDQEFYIMKIHCFEHTVLCKLYLSTTTKLERENNESLCMYITSILLNINCICLKTNLLLISQR